MKKRLLSIVLALVVAMTFSVQAFAASEDLSTYGVSSPASGTVKDSVGNTYALSGTSTKMTYGGKFTTSYTLKYYSGGDTSADTSAKKTFSVTGTITFVSADTYATASNSSYNWSTSGSVTASKTGLAYVVSTTSGTHTLKTDANSVTGYSVQT